MEQASSSQANYPLIANPQEQAQAQQQMRPADYLLLAVWFGLFTGLAEVFTLAISKIFLHRYLHIGIDSIWMIPLADILIFAVPGLILSLATLRSTRSISLRTTLFLYVCLGVLSLLLKLKWLNALAALVLSMGIAIQVSRFISAHPRILYSLIRFTTGWTAIFDKAVQRSKTRVPTDVSGLNQELSRRQFLLSAGVAVTSLAAGVQSWQVLRERWAIANLVPARPQLPSVLLITLDTVRARNLSLYGYTRPTTPQLERLAKRGVRFDRALSAAPWTLPSHASMFTGRYPHELTADWNVPLDGTYPTLAEVLSMHGYLTAGFSANNIYLTEESGISRGFARYEDYALSLGRIITSPSLISTVANSEFLYSLGYFDYPDRKNAQQLNQDFLRWLSLQDTKRPFFAFLNYFDAHSPYLPPKPFDSMFGSRRPRVNPLLVPTSNWSPEEVEAQLDAYDGAITYLDHQVGLLLDDLENRDMLANTLVVIASDHGEEFYEHRIMGHNWGVYLTSLHVPLLILFPSHVPAGVSVPGPVTLRDLPATLLDLLDLDDQSVLPGTSLARYWDRTRESEFAGRTISPILSELTLEVSDLPEWYPIRRGDLKSLIIEHYHYIRSDDGHEELYDLENDPLERRDLVDTETGRQELDLFRAALKAILKQS